MIYLSLFIAFLKIGAFSFGGGYAMLPLIEEEIVLINQWLTHQEFIDIIAISQMSPGPIAVNAATFVGYKHIGISGAIVATIGVVFTSFILVTTLAKVIIKYYNSTIVTGIFSGIRPAVIGLIAAACVSLFRSSIVDFKSLIIGLAVLGILYKTKLHPISVIMFSGVLGIIIFSI
ncbi:chromate transporter [Alkaliphilus peptidifermentans]|uniref:Chromate transporter n=1 Tax=Alkaliphilus peptidifermentans DSM 18978 TaxID=1120976 RepID=A0A1G5LAJ3_9FIRM|nr:chromate transporter [Alkaliphilus peptidifermentans]SCZ09915.1 chromate transporter [Alkaliphilus peptidifermentans DSM 18978]